MAKAGRPTLQNWVKVSDIARELGVSTRHISRLRENGRLKEDVHWRPVISANVYSMRPTYQYELNAVLKFWRSYAKPSPN